MSKTGLSSVIRGVVLLAVLAAACAPTAAPATDAPAGATQAPAVATQPPAAAEPQKIGFMAGFLPQGNISFVAVYVAKEKGFFDEVGLDVSIDHSGPGTGEHYQRLAAKQVQFITNPAETHVGQVADAQTPFKSVALFGHSGDHAIMYYDDGTITDLSDLEGKKLGFKGFVSPWVHSMLHQVGLNEGNVEMVPVGFDPRVILPEFGEGRVDAVTVFKSNEPNIMRSNGFPVGVFNPDDYGVHFLGQTYMTHDDFIRDDPEMVRKFVRATMRALAWILEPANKNEVTDIVMKYAGADADRSHMEYMWTTEIQYVTGPSTPEVGLGYASDEQWATMIDVMVEYGAIDAAMPVSRVWDPQFVSSIYQNGQLVWP
jgi:ABC-type nitrate/sulfonate/bicarbonate transport system substrate-binding protein